MNKTKFVRFVKFQFSQLVIATLCLVLFVGLLINPVVSQSPPGTEKQEIKPVWQPSQGSWQPVKSHREDRGMIKVVWLNGTSYEMGYQHGKLLHDEIASMGKEAIDTLDFFGNGLALARLAKRRSFPGVADECRGLVDATSDIGMTMNACMTLAFGDVYQEFFSYLFPKVLFNDGCANFAAAGKATVDGRLYHGRTLDNNKTPIKYWVENTTVFVRQPNDGIPHVFIASPGLVWPNSGLNAEGISISLDTAHPKDIEDLALSGKSNVQLMAEVMKRARNYQEAYAIMENNQRMRANLIMITDGKSRKAGVFELLGKEMGVRELNGNGALYMTNHFVSPQMRGKDSYSGESTLLRFKSFQQLMEPDGSRTFYGKIDPNVVVKILRDRTNPNTMQVSPLSVFDDDASIGGNGSLRQAVFDPERLLFWIAAGKVPIPSNPFTCFSLGEMLGLPNAKSCPSAAIN